MRELTQILEKLKELGYTCEACGFNFKKVYGKLSLNKKKEEYIEAHHKRQIQDLPEGEIVDFKIEDFSVLCSNCHRMVRKNPPYSVDEIRKYFKKKKAFRDLSSGFVVKWLL